jgi:Tol biopolymer transport system component
VDVAADGSRVLMTARTPGSLTEIFSAPFAGGDVTKLNQTLAPGVSAFPGPITPDSTRVVYGTRTDCVLLPTSRYSCPVELFVVPLEGGSSTPLGLPELPLDGPPDLTRVFSISPDGELGVSVMYERLPEDVNEDPDPVVLFSVPLAGGLATVLHEGAWFNDPFEFAGDGQRVVYDRAGELFSVNVGGGLAERLSPDLPLPGSRLRFSLTPDGAHTIYAQDGEQGFRELYSVTTAGGERTTLSHPDGVAGAFPWQVAPSGERVVFAQSVGPAFERALYSVPVTGGEPTLLSPPAAFQPGLRGIRGLRVSADRVVYSAEQDRLDLTDLYSVPIAGGPVTPLGGPVARHGTSGGLEEDRFHVTPDGTRVVFVVDSTDNVFDGLLDLYSVPIGGGVATKLNEPRPADHNISASSLEISPDGSHVVYLVSRPGPQPGGRRVLSLRSARLPPEIRIDIQPRKHLNKVPRGRRATIPVAILGSDEVDVTSLDLGTLGFGPDGAAPERKAKVADVDHDGFADLVTHYRRNETGIERGDTEACLSGSYDGFEFLSCDAVVTP